MKETKLILIATSLLIFFSCNHKQKNLLNKKWKVTKMEKKVKVMSNSYTYVDIGSTNNMSYNFMENNEVRIMTKYGSNLIGKWSMTDSLITVNVKQEIKEFKILNLTDKNLTMTSGKFKFHLKNKQN